MNLITTVLTEIKNNINIKNLRSQYYYPRSLRDVPIHINPGINLGLDYYYHLNNKYDFLSHSNTTNSLTKKQ